MAYREPLPTSPTWNFEWYGHMLSSNSLHRTLPQLERQDEDFKNILETFFHPLPLHPNTDTLFWYHWRIP